jgi:hypothetical protein
LSWRSKRMLAYSNFISCSCLYVKRWNSIRWNRRLHDTQHNDIQHNDIYRHKRHHITAFCHNAESRIFYCYARCRYAAKFRYAECNYAECHYAQCRGPKGQGPYSQLFSFFVTYEYDQQATLHLPGKACQWQTLRLIGCICNLRRKWGVMTMTPFFTLNKRSNLAVWPKSYWQNYLEKNNKIGG